MKEFTVSGWFNLLKSEEPNEYYKLLEIIEEKDSFQGI
jgi:hypothetical protein